MRENADRARQGEQAATELGSKPSSQKMTAVMPVDVHRYVPLLDRGDRGLDRVADRGVASGHDAGAFACATSAKSGAVRGSTGWNRWPNPGTIFSPASRCCSMTAVAAVDEIARLAGFRVDLAIELHALLSGAAVEVVEHVDRRRHRAVDRQSARDRHARDAIDGACGP
jgi:hypothetical protein